MTGNKTKQLLGLIAFGVTLYVILSNTGTILGIVRGLIDIVMPVIIGGVLAFIISVPMRKIEQAIDWICIKIKINSNKRKKIVPIMSFISTLVLILGVVILVGIAVIPKLAESAVEVYARLKDAWPEWSVILSSYGLDISNSIAWLDTLDFKEIIGKYSGSIIGILSNVVGKTSSIISTMITVVSAIVIMIHTTISKNSLARQFKKLLYATVKQDKADKIIRIASLVKDTYSKFLSGQFIEAIILGVLMFIALTIFRIEYAALIAVLTSVCAFVPYIGAFISCGVAVILTLLTSPMQALICFIVYEVVQFIENQFIYPKVVGESVGMSPLFTFLAVLLGGKLMGLVGILFFIPLTAVVYTLVKEFANTRLRERNIRI